MSRVGRISAVIFFVAMIVGVALLGAGNNKVTIADLSIGDCFLFRNEEVQSGLTSFDLVACDEALDSAAAGGVVAAYVLDVGQLAESDTAYPSDADLLALADLRCQQFSEVSPAVIPLLPDADAWNAANGPYACLSISLG